MWWAHDLGLNLLAGDGWAPTKQSFQRLRADSGVSHGFFQGDSFHPNPRFFKNIWWIITEMEATTDIRDRSFKARDRALCTAAAMARMLTLKKEQRYFMVIMNKLKRLDPDAPWDLNIIRNYPERTAPARAEDTDPPWLGHK